MKLEEWRPIKDLDGYDVSSFGRIRSWRYAGSNWVKPRKPRILKLGESMGYYKFSAQINGTTTSVRVARVVAKAFLGEPPFAGATVDHIDSNRKNNRIENLQYLSMRDNLLKGSGPTAINSRKTHCIYGHALTADNLCKYRLPKRNCATCARERYMKEKALRSSL